MNKRDVSYYNSILEKWMKKNRPVVQLAEVLSLAVRIEPTLLRTARLKFMPTSDASMEADLWFSPFIGSRTADWIVMEPAFAKLLRKRLALTRERTEVARELINEAHRGLFPTLAIEEEILWLCTVPDAAAKDKIDRKLQSIYGKLMEDLESNIGLLRWFHGAVKRFPELVRETPTFYLLAFWSSTLEEGKRVPELSSPTDEVFERLLTFIPENFPTTRVWCALTTKGLSFRPDEATGYKKIELPDTKPILFDMLLPDGKKKVYAYYADKRETLECDPGRLTLRTISGETFRIIPDFSKGASSAGGQWEFFSGPEKISLAKLPTTGPVFFGREKELNFLDNAWLDKRVTIVTLISWGGVGKSALVNQWLENMAKDNYRGARRVYGWSFYSQGAEEDKQASADEFVLETLRWFGDPDPFQGSPVSKGRRLAELVKKKKTLLILDGLEPLQYPPGEITRIDGRLKDPDLGAFLKDLAAGQPGLCVITSRAAVSDLDDKKGRTLREIDLDNLSTSAGVMLLKNLGIRGSDKEIRKAVEEYDGHALTLNLLGKYLEKIYKGDIRKRDKIPQLTQERTKGGHARRIMAAYESWLGESSELNILRIMGLFDRPVDEGAIDALRANPLIRGVTDQLRKMSEKDWQLALANLRNVNLLKKAAHQDTKGSLDSHPLVREYFGEKLKKEYPKGWQAAHERLYHYYKNLPMKELPDTLEELKPLFAAVAHGCKAGKHQEALDEVYWKRILRGDGHYLTNKLGAFGSNLAVLSNFFDTPWSQPSAGLKAERKAIVMSWAAFGLRAVGRLVEAIQPMKASLEMSIKRENWNDAAKNANHLSELLLTLGQMKESLEHSRQAVDFADKSEYQLQRITARTTIADALHQAGELKEAEAWFKEAESIQKQQQPEYHYLYSVQGFKYCDLLLEQGRVEEVLERAERVMEWQEKNASPLLNIALFSLVLARAWMMRAKLENSYTINAANYCDRAVQGFRKAGEQDFLARGLIDRADIYRFQNRIENTWDDLNEAKEIIDLGDMKLHLVDYHLTAGKICITQGDFKEGKLHFNTAEQIISETGYLRRKNEVSKIFIEIAKTYSVQKKWDDAVIILKQLLDLEEENLQARTELSKIYQQQRKWQDAENILREVLDIDPKYLWARSELGRIYQHQNRWEEAEKKLMEILNLDSNNLFARVELNKIYQHQKRWQEAEKVLKEALSLDMNNFQVHTELSKIYQHQNQWQKAEKVLLKSLQIDFNNLHVRTELSKVYQRQKKWQKAEKILLETLQLDPNHLHARIELSKVYQRQKKWQEAEKILLETLQLDLSNLHTRTELSKIYQRQKKWQEAEKILLETLQLDHKHLHTRTELSKIYQRQKKWQEAEKILLETLQLDPNHLHTRTELSKIYQQQKNYEKAESILLESLEIENNYAPSLLLLSRIYKKTRRFDLSEQYLKQILKIDPMDLQALRDLSDLYKVMNRSEERKKILSIISDLKEKGSLFKGTTGRRRQQEGRD